MIRTVISLGTDEKIWLDQMAKAKHVSMAEIIRKAIKEYRKKQSQVMANTAIDALLEKTSGIWPNRDGLAYQTRIRDEWEK